MDFVTTYDDSAKTWSGPQVKGLFDADCSVGRIVQHMMKSKSPEEICQICDSENVTLTYGQALQYAVRVAQHFEKLGLTADDVVGVIAPNTSLLMPVAVGCFLHGTPYHAINPMHEEHVIGHLLNISKPKVVFCDGNVLEKIKKATADLKPIIFTLCNHVEGVARVEDLLTPTQTEMFYQAKPLKYGRSQTAVLCCSSGTTGLPKAVTISNETLTVDYGIANGSDTTLSFSTPDWTTGLFSLMFNVLIGGKRIITTKPFSADYLLELVAKYKVTFLVTCPTHMSEVVLSPLYTKETMQSIRIILVSGGHCSVTTLASIRAQLTHGYLINAYASTEYGTFSANLTAYKPKSVGKIVPNNNAKIVNEETGERRGVNEIGEVCFRNAREWRGYYGNAQATEQAFDAEGWFRTGDMGYFDDESYLHLVDRCKDIMKFKGMQYSPHEIEETIAELPDILDVCVFGVWCERDGDAPAAAVVLREGSTLSVAQIEAHVESRQEVAHKRLQAGIYFVQRIARNANGKTLRRQVRAECLGEQTQ